jgi:hypothetical protein
MFPSYREKEKNEAAATRALAKWRDLPAKVLLPHGMHLLRLLEVFYRISVCIHAKGIPQQSAPTDPSNTGKTPVP